MFCLVTWTGSLGTLFRLIRRQYKHVEPFLGNCSGNTFPRQRIRIQQYMYFWKRCSLLGPFKRVTMRTIESRIVQSEGCHR
jgi:hypothetical protein